MTSPRVSAIIIGHNEEAVFEGAIRSALEQTVEDLEVVAVDDGSTDRTLEILHSINDSRLTVVSQAQAGPNAARNRGIRASRAPWLAFLDADDRWHRRKLADQLAVAEANPAAGLVYCACECRDEAGALLAELHPSLRGRVADALALGNRISGSASAVCIRRDVFDTVGVFDESMRYAEDWEMWLRIAARYEVDFAPAVLVTITQRARSHGRNPEGILNGALEVLRRAEAGCLAGQPALINLGRAEAHYTAAVNFADADVFGREMLETLRSLRYDPGALRAWRRLVRAPLSWVWRRVTS